MGLNGTKLVGIVLRKLTAYSISRHMFITVAGRSDEGTGLIEKGSKFSWLYRRYDTSHSGIGRYWPPIYDRGRDYT
jgi:hypothetical protein